MKTRQIPFFYLTIISLSVISCNDDFTNSEVQSKQIDSKGINPSVSIPSKYLNYDENYLSKESKSIEENRKAHSVNKSSIKLSRINSATSTTLTSDEIVVTVPQKTFIGAVYNSNTLDDLSYSAITSRVEPITISYSFPTDFIVDTIERPSLSSMRASVFKAMKAANFSGQQMLSFDYNIKQFSYYSELKLAFGSNINIGKIFSIDISGSNNKIKKNTGIFAKFTQKNFTMDMDIPEDGNIFLTNSDLSTVLNQNPVYISSITYGRLGIISLVSNYTYDEVSFALKAALNAKVVNGTLNIDVNSKKILDESDLSVYIVGGKGTDAVQVVTGFEGFSNFIINGGQFTAEAPGVPIYFSASHASDNSIYNTSFNIEN